MPYSLTVIEKADAASRELSSVLACIRESLAAPDLNAATDDELRVMMARADEQSRRSRTLAARSNEELKKMGSGLHRAAVVCRSKAQAAQRLRDLAQRKADEAARARQLAETAEEEARSFELEHLERERGAHLLKNEATRLAEQSRLADVELAELRFRLKDIQVASRVAATRGAHYANRVVPVAAKALRAASPAAASSAKEGASGAGSPAGASTIKLRRPGPGRARAEAPVAGAAEHAAEHAAEYAAEYASAPSRLGSKGLRPRPAHSSASPSPRPSPTGGSDNSPREGVVIAPTHSSMSSPNIKWKANRQRLEEHSKISEASALFKNSLPVAHTGALPPPVFDTGALPPLVFAAGMASDVEASDVSVRPQHMQVHTEDAHRKIDSDLVIKMPDHQLADPAARRQRPGAGYATSQDPGDAGTDGPTFQEVARMFAPEEPADTGKDVHAGEGGAAAEGHATVGGSTEARTGQRDGSVEQTRDKTAARTRKSSKKRGKSSEAEAAGRIVQGDGSVVQTQGDGNVEQAQDKTAARMHKSSKESGKSSLARDAKAQSTNEPLLLRASREATSAYFDTFFDRSLDVIAAEREAVSTADMSVPELPAVDEDAAGDKKEELQAGHRDEAPRGARVQADEWDASAGVVYGGSLPASMPDAEVGYGEVGNGEEQQRHDHPWSEVEADPRGSSLGVASEEAHEMLRELELGQEQAVELWEEAAAGEQVAGEENAGAEWARRSHESGPWKEEETGEEAAGAERAGRSKAKSKTSDKKRKKPKGERSKRTRDTSSDVAAGELRQTASGRVAGDRERERERTVSGTPPQSITGGPDRRGGDRGGGRSQGVRFRASATRWGERLCETAFDLGPAR